ncbi:MAG: ABC transporter ATP-binding protein [Gammaproteobacteria bacterium]|nr:ABC transporter ATP-binding protein [Gammaproteobacteria bacterium]
MSTASPNTQQAAASPALLEVENLTVRFRLGRQNEFTALHGISYAVAPNQTVALVGESGSGKTVSALAVMDLLPRTNTIITPESRLRFNGEPLLEESPAQRRLRCGGQISMIFQDPMTSLNPVYSVGEQLVEILQLHAICPTRAAARARAIELLGEVGIPDPRQKVKSYPHELSGGQQQRVMIAMAIACAPRLLIADEPTTALDVTIQQQILELLVNLKRSRGMSMLFITHDLALVREVADRVVVMNQGHIRESGATGQIFEAPADNYTRALLACRPRIDRRPVKLPVVEDFMKGSYDIDSVAERERGVDSDDTVVLEVDHLRKTYPVKTGWFGEKQFVAVDDVSFRLARGKTLGIVGESGSGKTTLGKAILRLHEAQGGSVRMNGVDLLKLSRAEFQPYKRQMQIVFQNPYASLNPRFTISDILLEPMRIHNLHAGDAERIEHATALLRQVGLSASDLRKYPHEFSGGQLQRISIARCLALKPDILVCDEPVSALDVSVQAQVLNLFQALQDEFAISYLFISHDLNVVKYISDEIMVMHNGAMVEYGNADELYRNPQHPYTQRLLAAIPGRQRHS